MTTDHRDTIGRRGDGSPRRRCSERPHSRADGDSDRSVDIRITRIRKKIETDPARPRFIRTARGEGHVFVPGDA